MRQGGGINSAQRAAGAQRVIECDLQDSALVVELLRAQGWESDEMGVDDGRAVIRVGRDDVPDGTDAVRGALEESGSDVSVA